MNAAIKPQAFEVMGLGVRSHDDLSFTRREGCSDEFAGRLNNWFAPHSNDDYWHRGQEEGHRRFREVLMLALHDETAAAEAIRFALNSPGWKGGWGEEDGFAHALSRVVIVGVRALQSGAEPFVERESAEECEEEQSPDIDEAA